jgi:Domain of unkown function (DUF1775)
LGKARNDSAEAAAAHFGSVLLNKITNAMVREWVSTLLSSGLSAATTRKAVFALRQCLAAAIADERIKINAASAVPLPTEPRQCRGVPTKTRQLDKPIEMFGEQLNTVVSEVTWTATDGGIRPGQFQDFNVSLGQLPESGQLVFNALQTYSSGEKVNWNQVSTDPAVEPEHPAPILTITPAAAAGSGATDQGGQAGQQEQATSAAQSDEGSASTLPLVVSGAALVLSLVAVVLGWRRGRRPAPAVEAASPSREDAKV